MPHFLKDGTVQVSITSVILDVTSPNGMMHMFNCYNCRFPISQYSNEVIFIGPGMVPSAYPVVTMCHSCKKKYMFSGIARQSII